MEREETEEKESVRKTEKERHEMKYKVGDKVRVRKDLKVSKEYDGMIFNDVMSQHCGETVTINEVFSRGYYRIVEYGCCWTDGMLTRRGLDRAVMNHYIQLRHLRGISDWYQHF